MRKSALIVANWNYEDPLLRGLVAPSQDAEALGAVLRDAAIGGFDVQVLTNTPSYRVCEETEAFFGDRDRDDLLLYYFSGHGVTDDDGQLYYAASNTLHKRLRSTAVAASWVNDIMNGCRSRRQILMLDCCHSGAFARTKAATGAVNVGKYFTGATPEEGRGKFILTASDAFQYSFEGDAVEGKGVSSVFTEAVVEGLRTGAADIDGDGQITLDELYSFVYTRVREKTTQQTPRKWATDVEGDVVIAANPSPAEAPLPEDLQGAIDSFVAEAREKAVARLDRLLRGKHRGLALTAYKMLLTLAHDDSRRVSSAAEKCLAAWNEECAAATAEADRAANERAEASQRLEQEQAERQRLAQAQSEALRLAKIANERAAREHADRIAAEQAEAERLAQEKAAAKKAEAERIVREEAEAARKAKAERMKREKAEAATRAEKEQAERDRLAAESAEAARKAKEKAAAEQAEADRIASKKAEAERARRADLEAHAAALAAEEAKAEELIAGEAVLTRPPGDANHLSLFGGITEDQNHFPARLTKLGVRAASLLATLRDPLLLFLRLYCGLWFTLQAWPFNMVFASELQLEGGPLTVAHAMGWIETCGGILIALGIASRLVSLALFLEVTLMSVFMSESILQWFRPQPFDFSVWWYIVGNYLAAALLILCLGPGRFSIDTLLARRFKSSHSSRPRGLFASSDPPITPSDTVQENRMSAVAALFIGWYTRAATGLGNLQPYLLLCVRLYCGVLFLFDGASSLSQGSSMWAAILAIPQSSLAGLHLMAGIEILLGILLALGAASRIVSLACFLLVTTTWLLIPSVRTEIPSFLIDTRQFFPSPVVFWNFRFWLGSLLVLVLGPGSFAIDRLLARRKGASS